MGQVGEARLERDVGNLTLTPAPIAQQRGRGPVDDNVIGAAWVFTRPGTIWSEQQKLIGTGYVGPPNQGAAATLSADGNTALVGGPSDNNGTGAAWLFVQRGWSTASAAAHDFNGDGTSDILWRNSSGQLALWLIRSGRMLSGANISTVPAAWSLAGTRVFDDDGNADILWLDNAGDVAVWQMNGLAVSAYDSLGNVGTSWTVQGQNAD